LEWKPSVSRFERGRHQWWARIPSVTRNASGRASGAVKTVSRFEQGRGLVGATPSVTRNTSRGGCDWSGNPPARVSSEGGHCGGRENPPSFETRAEGVGVGVKTLQLAFRAREGPVVGIIALQHSKCEWEGSRWRENPPARISSKGGVGVTTWWWARRANSLHYSKREQRGLWLA
jgi:hypothetical protein